MRACEAYIEMVPIFGRGSVSISTPMFYTREYIKSDWSVVRKLSTLVLVTDELFWVVR